MTNPAKDVLIVEDDDSIRNLVALAPARAGLTCDTAEDGVEHLTEKRYSVLLLDMSMPRHLVKGCVTSRQRNDGFEQVQQ